MQVRTAHGGAALCNSPYGIAQQGETIAVSSDYNSGVPQRIELLGGADVEGDAFSGSDASDPPRTISISRSGVDFIVNRQQKFDDPVIEILADRTGILGTLATTVNSSPSNTQGGTTDIPIPAACPDISKGLSAALGTEVTANHADAYISDSTAGDITCEWRLPERVRNGFPVLLVVLIRPNADWAEEEARFQGTKTPIPTLGPNAVYVTDTVLSSRIVAAQVGGVYVRVLFTEDDVSKEEVVNLVSVIQEAMHN